MPIRKFLESSEEEQKRHRIESASALFQKGIYHLFVLKNNDCSDAYDCSNSQFGVFATTTAD